MTELGACRISGLCTSVAYGRVLVTHDELVFVISWCLCICVRVLAIVCVKMTCDLLVCLSMQDKRMHLATDTDRLEQGIVHETGV